MNALYQRLKELDCTSFERLCFHLLSERHPTAGVTRVEGAAGDDGADTFAGRLGAGPIVWQAKAFPNGVGKSRRAQIRKALKRAVDKRKPRFWVLFISTDLDIHAHRWWQRLKKSYAKKVEMGLRQASDIAIELSHRKTTCELFFPGAVLNVSELRALMTGSASASDVQLSALAEETSEQLIERFKARDARFNYQLVVTPENNTVPTPSNVVFSVTSGRTTVNAFARDLDALKLDPPKLNFQVKGPGIEKMRAFMETGKPQKFEAAELGGMSTTIGLIELDNSGSQTLLLAPSSVSGQRVIPFRVIFGSGGDAVTYEYFPFRVNRAGSKEVELISEGNDPFSVSFVLRVQGGSFTFREKTMGFSVRSGDKWVRALRALQLSERLELYDLQTEQRIVLGQIAGDFQGSYLSQYEAFFKEATEISDHFGAELQLRRAVTEPDAEAFTFLRQLMAGGTLDLGPITGVIEKLPDDTGFPAAVWEGKPCGLRLDHCGRALALLDTEVQTGPFSLTVEVRLQNAADLRQQWLTAAEGARLATTWEPVGPARVVEEVQAKPTT